MSIRKNFASRLSLYVLLVSAGLLLTVTVLFGIFARMAIKNEARENAAQVLDNTILEIEKVITEVERSVDNVDWMVDRFMDDESFLYEVTRELVVTNPNVVGSAVAFEPGYYKGRAYFAPFTSVEGGTGELHSFQLGSEQYDYPMLDWYQIPKLLDRPYWSEPYFDEGGGERRVSTYSVPLKDREGRFYGILTADLSLEWLSDKVVSLKPYKQSYTFLLGRNASYIAHPDSSRVLNETIFTVDAIARDSTAMRIARDVVSGGRDLVSFTFDGKEAFAVYGPLSNGWSLVTMCSYADLFSYARLTNLVMAVMLFLGLAGLFFGCRRIIRRLTMPIVEFSNAAMTIAKGNFNATIPEVTTKDELKKLRDSLAYMQRSINDYIAELKTTTAANQRYESELNIGREIQMSMLPDDFPDRPDFDLYAMVQPAKEVGGDLYDFTVVGDSVYFLVGDVSGKGVPAALFMAITRAAFRFIGALGLPMSEVVGRVNNCLCDGNDSGMFVTLFAGRLDLSTGVLTYCNAGHNPIVVIPPGGEAIFLRAQSNLAAGLYGDFPYQEENCRLEHGTRLLLYTDGVTEAERADKEQFGDSRLLQWASGLGPSVRADSVVRELYARVRHFAEGTEQNDDITILSLLWK